MHPTHVRRRLRRPPLASHDLGHDHRRPRVRVVQTLLLSREGALVAETQSSSEPHRLGARELALRVTILRRLQNLRLDPPKRPNRVHYPAAVVELPHAEPRKRVERQRQQSVPKRTSGWSSKASEAELKGVEGGD